MALISKPFFITYLHQPTPVDPGLLILSLGLSNTPVIGDLYDLYTGVTGYDPITGQYLAGWERLVTLVGVLPILGIAGANLRDTDETIELVGFRGIDFKIEGGKYADEAALIKAGHVGVSFDSGKTIYGFHPSAEATKYLSEAEVIGRLRAGESFADQVYDDTDIFRHAHDLGLQGAVDRSGNPLRVYSWKQRVSREDAAAIRASVLRQVQDPSQTITRYSFPIPSQSGGGYTMPHGCSNCATWPGIEGLRIPEQSGRLSEYIDILIELAGGNIWTP